MRTIFQNQQIIFLDAGKEDLPRRWTVRSIGYGPTCKKWAFPLDYIIPFILKKKKHEKEKQLLII